MFLILAIMVALTVAIAALWLAPRMGEGEIIFEEAPDRPKAFGYKMAWLAVRTRNTDAVVEVLGLVDPVPANWNSGIGTVYDDRAGECRVFVSPPVNGWTFVVGLSLPHPMSRGFVDKRTPMLLRLGGRFSEVQYFFSYPLIDFFAWARVLDGRLVRAFAASDEGVIWNKGKPTREEKALGLKLFELRGVRGRKGDAGGELLLHPTEDHVMRLAHGWSLDPTQIERQEDTAGRGVVAFAPAGWRPERLRKSA